MSSIKALSVDQINWILDLLSLEFTKRICFILSRDLKEMISM